MKQPQTEQISSVTVLSTQVKQQRRQGASLLLLVSIVWCILPEQSNCAILPTLVVGDLTIDQGPNFLFSIGQVRTDPYNIFMFCQMSSSNARVKVFDTSGTPLNYNDISVPNNWLGVGISYGQANPTLVSMHRSSNQATFYFIPIQRGTPLYGVPYQSMAALIDLSFANTTASCPQKDTSYTFFCVQIIGAGVGNLIIRVDRLLGLQATNFWNYFLRNSQHMPIYNNVARSIEVGTADTVVACNGGGGIRVVHQHSLQTIIFGKHSGGNIQTCKFAMYSSSEFIVLGSSAPGKVSLVDIYGSGIPGVGVTYQTTGTEYYRSIVMLGAFRFHVLFKLREVSLIDSGLTSVQVIDLGLPLSDIIFTAGTDLLDPYQPAFIVMTQTPGPRKAAIYKMSDSGSCLIRNFLGVCVQCSAGKYLSSQDPNNYCITQAQFLTGFGLEISTSTMKRCTSVGCADCKLDNTYCALCNIAQGFCQNPSIDNTQTTRCTSIQSLDNGYGLSSTGTITAEPCFIPCAVTGCFQCLKDAYKCTVCKPGQTPPMYLDPATSLCVFEANIAVRYGVDLNMQQVSICATGCLECRSNVIFCTKCDSFKNYFITPDKRCILANLVGDGYRADATLGTIEACSSGCMRCLLAKQTCTSCFPSSGYAYDPIASTCVSIADLPNGKGIDLKTGAIKDCAVQQCQVCKGNADLCEICKPTYILNPTTFTACDLDTFTLYTSIEINPVPQSKSSQIVTKFNLYLTPALAKSADQEVLTKELADKMTFYVNYTDPNNNLEFVTFDTLVTYVPASSSLPPQIQILLTVPPKAQLLQSGFYTVKIVNQSKYASTINGQQYIVFDFEGVDQLKNTVSKSELAAAEQQAGAVGSMAPTTGTGLSLTITLFALISADPTGLLMRVSQILQVVSKLAFININYGTKLEAFFSKIGELFEGYGSPTDDKYVLNSDQTRGKLSRYRVNLDLINKFSARLFPYIVSWMIKIAIYFTPDTTKLSVWQLQVVYMLPKFHALIFNLVFFDLIFYACRTILHSKGLPISTTFGMIGLLLLCFDFSVTFIKILDDNAWRKLYFFFKSQKAPTKKETQALMKIKTQKKLAHVPDNMLTSEESETEEEFKSRTSRPIDYPKTWEEIKFDYHMYDFLSEFLTVDKAVYQNKMCRSYYMIHIVRISAYHFVVVAGQYLSGFVRGSLLFLEVFKVLYTLYMYIRYRYLKFFVLVLMETCQSIIFGIFLTLSMITYMKDKHAPMSESFQNTGLYCVMLSVLLEYILLAFYIFFMIGSSINNARRLGLHKKRSYYVEGIFHPKKVPFSFINYVNVDEEKRQKRIGIKAFEVYDCLEEDDIRAGVKKHKVAPAILNKDTTVVSLKSQKTNKSLTASTVLGSSKITSGSASVQLNKAKKGIRQVPNFSSKKSGKSKEKNIDITTMQSVKDDLGRQNKTKDADDSELNSLDQTDKISESQFGVTNEPSDRVSQTINQDTTMNSKIFKYNRQKLKGEIKAEEQAIPSVRNTLEESIIIRSRQFSYKPLNKTKTDPKSSILASNGISAEQSSPIKERNEPDLFSPVNLKKKSKNKIGDEFDDIFDHPAFRIHKPSSTANKKST